jgi:hypothetical protein
MRIEKEGYYQAGGIDGVEGGKLSKDDEMR